MNGYVRNDGQRSMFIAQRTLNVTQSVKFDDLLKVFSNKSGFTEVGLDFVVWLSKNVFTTDQWGFYNHDDTPYVFEPVEDVPPVVESEPEQVVVVAEEVKPKPPPKKRRRAKPKPKKVNQEKASVEVPDVAQGAGQVFRRPPERVKGIKITPGLIIEADYTEARGLINQCKERTVLKKALALTKHFSGKEAHMRHLIKRVEEVIN